MSKTLTVFTPTYNRAHTLPRTYASLCRQTCDDFIWMIIDDGSTDSTRQLAEQWIAEKKIEIRYIYKENGGLFTGYNTAFLNIDTELNVCIDSDDFMPDDAVEVITRTWREQGSDRFCGIIGLDFYLESNTPIGGYFPDDLKECYYLDLYTKKIHIGDTKQVMRTDLMRAVAPQVGFEGEKNFNPVYMLLQVCDDRPMIVLNRNLCTVEYQEGDSMSKAIFKQYFNSPRSFSKLRRLEMTLKRSDMRNILRVTTHYIATCLIARDRRIIADSPRKALTIALLPAGALLYLYLRHKVRHNDSAN